jgi:hypothetical protein
MRKKTSEILDRLIEQLSSNIFLSNHIDLFNGQAGIAILLYYFSRYRKDEQIQNIADKLLDFIIERISQESEDETAGIALSIYNLMNDKFIEPDITVFEDIDNWLFENSRKQKDDRNYNECFLTGIYIYRRMTFDQSDNITLWRERMKNYFKSTYSILCNKIYAFNLPVFKCSDLLLFFYLCSKVENDDYFKNEIELIYRDLILIIEISMREDDNNSDKYLLSLLINESNLGYSNKPLIHTWNRISLMDINHFFLYRYLLRLDILLPKVIQEEIRSIVNNEKRIDKLLSLLCPNTSGLNNYVAGFAWALLQMNMENGIDCISCGKFSDAPQIIK